MRLFDRIASAVSNAASHPVSFMLALVAILVLNVAGFLTGQLKAAYDIGGAVSELLALLLLFLLHRKERIEKEEA